MEERHSNAIGCEKHDSRSCYAVIRVYDAAGNVIETHEHKVYPHGIVKYIMVKNERNAT